MEALELVAHHRELPRHRVGPELEAVHEMLGQLLHARRVFLREDLERVRVMRHVEGRERVEVLVGEVERRPAEAASDGTRRHALGDDHLAQEVVFELVDLLAHPVERRRARGVELLHRHVLRGRVAHERDEREDDLPLLARQAVRPAEVGLRDRVHRLALAARADVEVGGAGGVRAAAQQPVVGAQRKAQRPEAADAREHVVAVALARRGQPLLDEARLDRAEVRLVDDLARPPAPHGRRRVLAQLVDVGVFDDLALGEHGAQVREKDLRPRVRARVEDDAPLDERRPRQRRAAVVERRCRAFAAHRVDLARHIHVKRLDERGGGLVGELRPRQEGAVERDDLLNATRRVRRFAA